MNVLIGSRAAKYRYSDFPREPNDFDCFSPQSQEGTDSFWHPAIERWPFGTIATGDELYTIKVSHAFWNLHGTWSKHMHDIRFFQSKGAQFLPDLFQILYPIWEELHGKKKANLNATPEEFFNNKVLRVYEHDSIHMSIAYYTRPLFERILRDDHDVAVDRGKFDALDYLDKLRLVREEVYATALERQLIPSNYKSSPRGAYSWALMKLITSFSKGWFPLFIVRNYHELHKPDIDYLQLHKNNSDRLILL